MFMTNAEKNLSDRLIKREAQLKDLAQSVVDEMSDPSPELAKKLVKFTKGDFR